MASKKTTAADVTIEILRQIRNNIAQTNARLDAFALTTSERFDTVNDRLDALASAQAAVEMRLATEIVEVAKAVRTTNELLRELLLDRSTLNNHETRITELEKKAV